MTKNQQHNSSKNVAAQAGVSGSKLATSQSEDRIQSECVLWFKNKYRNIRQLLYMNQNSGRKNRVQSTIDTALGLTPGIPDLFLAIPQDWPGYHGLYIEMKRPGQRPDNVQIQAMKMLTDEGYLCAVVDNLEAFQQLIFDYMKATKYEF